jgi:hypothetical protein
VRKSGEKVTAKNKRAGERDLPDEVMMENRSRFSTMGRSVASQRPSFDDGPVRRRFRQDRHGPHSLPDRREFLVFFRVLARDRGVGLLGVLRAFFSDAVRVAWSRRATRKAQSRKKQQTKPTEFSPQDLTSPEHGR